MLNNIERFFLHPGSIFVSESPYLIHTVLGSCVSVCIWDSLRKYGGMNHFIYSRSKSGERNGKYGDVSTRYMISIMLQNGSHPADLRAHVIGGGFNTELNSVIGEENCAVAVDILARSGIRIVTRDTGGQTGRKVIFNNISGEVIVYKGINVRKTDWYTENEKAN